MKKTQGTILILILLMILITGCSNSTKTEVKEEIINKEENKKEEIKKTESSNKESETTEKESETTEKESETTEETGERVEENEIKTDFSFVKHWLIYDYTKIPADFWGMKNKEVKNKTNLKLMSTRVIGNRNLAKYKLNFLDTPYSYVTQILDSDNKYRIRVTPVNEDGNTFIFNENIALENSSSNEFGFILDTYFNKYTINSALLELTGSLTKESIVGYKSPYLEVNGYEVYITDVSRKVHQEVVEEEETTETTETKEEIKEDENETEYIDVDATTEETETDKNSLITRIVLYKELDINKNGNTEIFTITVNKLPVIENLDVDTLINELTRVISINNIKDEVITLEDNFNYGGEKEIILSTKVKLNFSNVNIVGFRKIWELTFLNNKDGNTYEVKEAVKTIEKYKKYKLTDDNGKKTKYKFIQSPEFVDLNLHDVYYDNNFIGVAFEVDKNTYTILSEDKRLEIDKEEFMKLFSRIVEYN